MNDLQAYNHKSQHGWISHTQSQEKEASESKMHNPMHLQHKNKQD